MLAFECGSKLRLPLAAFSLDSEVGRGKLLGIRFELQAA
jgi:hypothetical protein